jgi:hypothetical protein
MIVSKTKLFFIVALALIGAVLYGLHVTAQRYEREGKHASSERFVRYTHDGSVQAAYEVSYPERMSHIPKHSGELQRVYRTRHHLVNLRVSNA